MNIVQKMLNKRLKAKESGAPVMHRRDGMRIISFLTIIFISNTAFAIGWRNVSENNAEEYGLLLQLQFSSSQECYELIASLPFELYFEELGNRELWTVNYLKIDDGQQGQPLIANGTRISLPIIGEGAQRKIGSVCLSEIDLRTSYLSAVYGGAQGTPPMVLFINLQEFK